MTEDTEVLGRQLNQARSKPNPVNLPLRTDIMVHSTVAQRQFYF